MSDVRPSPVTLRYLIAENGVAMLPAFRKEFDACTQEKK